MAKRQSPTICSIRRVGLSMFVVDTPGGTRFVTDPWLSGNPTLMPDFGDDEMLRSLDAVLVSHGHIDHAEGLARIREANSEIRIVTTWELGNMLLRSGYPNVTSVNYGGSTGIGDVIVHFVPASHDSSYFSPDGGYSGLAAGVIITFESGYRLYYAGDTGLTAELAVIRDYWRPDIAIVPVGGGVFTMDPEQAAYAVGVMLRAPRAIPCHWFPPASDAPHPSLMAGLLEAAPAVAGASGHRGREFAEQVGERYPHVEVTVLELGDCVEVDVGDIAR